MPGEDKQQEALMRRITQGSENVNSEGSAIAIAKDRGLAKQSGGEVALTEKGRKAARKAAQTLKNNGYEWKEGEGWRKTQEQG